MVHDEEDAWARHARERERSRARLLILLASVLVPAWIPVDYVLEPQHAGTFLTLRLADVTLGLVLLAVLARARTLRAVRAAVVLKLLATGGVIAMMLALVTEYYWAYMYGFSLVFWATAVIVSLPWGTVAATFGAIVGMAAGAVALGPGRRTFEELVGGGFFTFSMVVICVALVALRGRLERRAFLFAHRLTEANKKVRESEALKTRFFANVSHELRTPLTLILGPTEKLLAARELSEDQRESLGVVLRNARMLLGHVDELLDVARLDLGQLGISYAKTDLARLVRSVASHFDGIAEERSIAYTLDLPAALPAEVDPDKARTVLLNLLSNAFKAAPPGGRVRCSLRRADEQHARLEVADSGPGIRPEHRAVVFERFRQLDGGRTRRLGGSGLGLAIARDFVELHRGTIAVGDAPEGGASFRVELPLGAPAGAPVRTAEDSDTVATDRLARALSELEGAAEAPPARAAGDEEAAPSEAPRILVVEDNRELNRFVCESLSPAYRTASALDGRAGLDKAVELEPDLIITDIMMPEMSGDQLIAAVRARPELDDIPIVVLSAREDDPLRVRLLLEGAQDYVMKPFSVAELRARVANLVAIKRARAVLQAELDTKEQSIERLAQDVTDQRRELQTALESARVARQVAEQASELKTNFLRLVSHELRSPLTALLLQLQRFEQSDEPISHEAQILFQRMERSANRLKDLVEGLLEYARIQSGKLRLEIEAFDVLALARQALEDVRPQARDKGLPLELDLPEAELPPLVSDPRLVRLILVNLLGNAVKFTDTGRVTLILGWEDGVHRLTVRDTGPGIPADQIARIFEPFEQLQPVRAKHLAGVGLGLSLVRELVMAIGGSIEVASAPGRGSTFNLRLPPANVERTDAG